MITTPSATSENVHSIANFKPEEYEVLDYLDNQRPRYMGQSIQALEAQIEAWKESIRYYFPTAACVTTGHVQQLPEHNIHKCRHCGNTNIRCIAVVHHLPTDTNLVFGDVCVNHLGFANRDEFKAEQIRMRAAQGNARFAIWNKRNGFLGAHLELKSFIDNNEIERPIHANNEFVRDILAKLNQYGELTTRQLEYVMKSIERDRTAEARAAAKAKLAAERLASNAPKAPVGRVTVEGKITNVKSKEGFRGVVVWKMLVALTNGTKVFVSIPENLWGYESEITEPRGLIGKNVKFTATFKQSETDPYFAFGKCPKKAEIIP